MRPRPVRVRVPGVRMSTANLQAVYPWLASPGVGDAGVYVGRAIAGAAWCYDPWALYEAGVITGPNMLVAGQIGSGKSALVKTMLWRQHAIGRRAFVIDPKGEYAPLAAACDATPIRLGGDSPVRINPLDPGRHDKIVVGRRQSGLVAALAATALDRPLSPAETTVCDLAVATANHTRPVAALPDVVDALLHPTDAAALADVAMSPDSAADAGRSVALVLRRLVCGDLAGIFDGPTSAGVDPTGDVVVIDLSAVADSDAESLVMLCAHSWLTQAIAAGPDEQRLDVLDEAWRVLRHLHIARWLRASWKLSRAWGVANIAVVDRLSDLAAAGPAASEQRELARGRALWHVGDHRAVVDHLLCAAETAIVDTDQRMRSS